MMNLQKYGLIVLVIIRVLMIKNSIWDKKKQLLRKNTFRMTSIISFKKCNKIMKMALFKEVWEIVI